MDLQLSTDGDTIYTASTDKTVCLWDTRTGARIKKLKGKNNQLKQKQISITFPCKHQQVTLHLLTQFILPEEAHLCFAVPQMIATSKFGIQEREQRLCHWIIHTKLQLLPSTTLPNRSFQQESTTTLRYVDSFQNLKKGNYKVVVKSVGASFLHALSYSLVLSAFNR